MLKIGIAGQRGLAFLKAFRTLSGIEALGAGKHVLSEASIY